MVLSIWNSNKFYRQQRVDSPSERSTRPLEFMNLPKLIAVKAHATLALLELKVGSTSFDQARWYREIIRFVLTIM